MSKFRLDKTYVQNILGLVIMNIFALTEGESHSYSMQYPRVNQHLIETYGCVCYWLFKIGIKQEKSLLLNTRNKCSVG